MKEVDRLAAEPAVAELFDLERLRELVRSWPRDNWARQSVISTYRMLLLRTISAAHFVAMAAAPGSEEAA
jgi:hypothetical protein